MQDNLNFNVNRQFEVDKENVSAILLDVDVKKANNAIADISDLNKCRVDLTLKRENSEPVPIFKGFLQNLLNVLYTQSTQMELVTKKLDSGYKILLSFGNYPITLRGKDKLVIDLYFPTSAFTSSVVANSSINIETIQAPTPNKTGLISVYDMYIVPNGKSSFDDTLGSSVTKVLLEVDNSATYDASDLAKPVDVNLIASGDFSSIQTENALIAQNMQMLHYNPTSSVKNLWLYNSSKKALNDVTARIKFDKPVTAASLIQVERMIFA